MLQCKLIALCALVFCSCASAVPVRIVSRCDLSAIPYDDKVHANDRGGEMLHVQAVKYLVRVPGSTPSASINNRSIELCLKGKFPEAEILLLQIPVSDSIYASVCNNLGVVYECSGDNVRARNFYIRASVLDPSCLLYLRNLRTVKENER